MNYPLLNHNITLRHTKLYYKSDIQISWFSSTTYVLQFFMIISRATKCPPGLFEMLHEMCWKLRQYTALSKYSLCRASCVLTPRTLSSAVRVQTRVWDSLLPSYWLWTQSGCNAIARQLLRSSTRISCFFSWRLSS